MSKFTIVRDTQEKVNFWNFIKTDYCEGTINHHLSTGDYSIAGLEDKFVIERKATASELYGNLCTADFKRFSKELERLSLMPHSYIVCEFILSDIKTFPWSSDLPIHIKKKIGNKGDFFFRKLFEIQTQYRIPIIFAGSTAKESALSIFKRINDLYDTVNKK